MSGRRSGQAGPNRNRGGKGPSQGRGRPGTGRQRERGATPTRPDSPEQPKGERKGLGGDHVEGRHAVRELLLAGTRPVREILMSGGMDAAPILEDILGLADEMRVPIREIGRSKFDTIARTESSQGVMANAAPVPSIGLNELIRPLNGKPPFLLALDGVTDPGNVGAILRTAECAGVTGVIFPKHRAAHLTPTVTKNAQGAIEHLRMTVVGGLPAALAKVIEAGIWTVGLDGSADQSLFDLNLAGEPTCLVLGSEGKGLSRLVRERADVVAALPLQGVLGSLNVGAAGAVAMYEVSRHR